MPSQAVQSVRQLNNSRNAADAFLEDMAYLREIASKEDISHTEIRQLSTLLVRLIVDRGIEVVASSRLDKIYLTAPDNRPYYRAFEQYPMLLFLSGGAKFFGRRVNRITTFDTGPKILENANGEAAYKKIPAPEDRVINTTLTLEQFAQQKVIFYKCHWVTRQAVIQYIANIFSGVRSDSPKTTDDIVLAQIRGSTAARFSIKGGGLHLDVFSNRLKTEEITIEHTPDKIDLVLMELLATATCLTASPMLAELERIVKLEPLF